MNEIVLPSRSRPKGDALTLSVAPNQPTAPEPIDTDRTESVKIDSAQDALYVLKSKPSLESFRNVLDFLSSDPFEEDKFSVKRPSPSASQIIFVLVNDVVPAYWQLLSQNTSQRGTLRRLVRCLRSPAGIAAATNRLKVLSGPGSEDRKGTTQAQGAIRVEHLQSCLELVECLLHGDGTLGALYADIVAAEPQKMKRKLLADGLVGLLGTGNVLSTAAQADIECRKHSKEVLKQSWVADGQEFSAWLGRNVLQMSKTVNQEDADAKLFRTSIFSKGLRLGQTEKLVGSVFASPLRGDVENVSTCAQIINDLPTFMQAAAIDVVLRLIASKFSMDGNDNSYVSGAAALLKVIVANNEFLLDHLVDWLADFVGGNIGFPFELFRAVVLLLSTNVQRLKRVFQSSLERFGSKRLIQQLPMLQQEVQTKILLIAAGYIHRADPDYLKQTRSTSVYLNAISNRLAASSTRLQFFGMVFGMSISGLVDKEGSTLNFDTEDIKSDEGKEFRGLVTTIDVLGDITDLKVATKETTDIESKKPMSRPAPKPAPKQQSKAKIIAIEEVEDSESEDDDLPVYAKPDSDPEDSDDDPSTVNRNKATAPVYIRDLLAGLRDDDNYDRHKLAIEHASALIRRKTSFGTEVSDHLEELATKLVGLKDSFSLDDFPQSRLQAMIAVILANPTVMGKWFGNTYFNGDYSMSQRASILSALALAARELAGLKDEDADMTGANEVPDFPSKRLPEKYAAMYQIEAEPVNKLSGKLERDIIKPMALEAADKATGPNILKVRTFSSRMAVEKKRKRAIPNQLAKVVADAFFYPLSGRWASMIRARGDGSVFTTPFLLSQFLRSLALILSAAGASTLALPGMTTEFWALLLSLRRQALADQSVLEALLFANLTLLEVNDGNARGLAEEHAQELMETQAWVQPVFENLRGGPKAEERVKMLASALLVKVKGVIDGYEKSLMGPYGGGR